ncbi:YadA family autotransporter adhesin [Pelistega suis]|uniref:YadA family autotransporter adhesin n=1 Tax=Pelistega suis TaxID=1631957 RepID=UPI00211C60BD|nr:YadA-like family protein [Pelistega suis]MCQ9328653.1 YadA-like family protein [Pelistega suis]
MNKIFKTKKDRHGKTVVCSELSRSNGKLKSLVLAVAAIGVVPAAQAADVVWESSLSSVQNDVLATAYVTPDANGNLLDETVLNYHKAANIIKITDKAGAAADLSVTANSTNETTLNTTKSNTLSLYRPGYTVTLDVPDGDVSAYTTTYTTDPSVLVIQDTDNTAAVVSNTGALTVTKGTPVANSADKGIGNHTTYTLDLNYDDTQFAVVNGKLSLANGVLGGGGDVPSTYFHVNNTTNTGTGDATTNYGTIDSAAGATGAYSVTAGVNATAVSNSTIAMGHGANAGISRPGVTGEMPTGDHAIAIGTNADAQSADTIAIGRNARVLFTEKETNVFAIPLKSIAIGADSKSQSEYSTAIGFEAIAGDDYHQSNATSVGARAKAININTLAVGSNANSSGTGSSALGVYSEASGNRATAVGFQSQATGDFGVALGAQADAAYLATATGTGAQAVAEGATATGYRANASGVNSIAIGRSTNATATNATSIGRLAQATHEDAVALGSGSITREATSENTATVGGVTYSGFAGNTPKSVVSFGNAGEERQLVNVAAGNISATSTDAINGSQLYALGSNINNQVNQVAGRVEQIGKQADRGAAIAGAMGMLPQPHLPGKSLVAVATTRYRGQQAAAIGYSRLSDNGKHIIKVSGSTGVNSGAGGRSTMVGAAYGYQW